MPDYNYDTYIGKFNKLCDLVVERRKELDLFLKYLREKMDFFEAPASSVNHLNVKHGLLYHSVGVTETLLKVKNTLAPQLSDESCVICGLFHDLGKSGYPGAPHYLKKGKGYELNKDIVEIQIAIRSLYMISQFIPLRTDEAQAIAYHDGQYIPQGKDVAHRESPLLTILHFADFYTAHVIEDDLPIEHGEYVK